MVDTIPNPAGATPSVLVHQTKEYWQLVAFTQRRLPLNDVGQKVQKASFDAAHELRCTHTTDDQGDTGQAARCRQHTRMTACVHNTYEAPGEVERPCVFIPKQLPDTSWWEVIDGKRLVEPAAFAGYSETVTEWPTAVTADAAMCAALCSSYDTPCKAFSFDAAA